MPITAQQRQQAGFAPLPNFTNFGATAIPLIDGNNINNVGGFNAGFNPPVPSNPTQNNRFLSNPSITPTQPLTSPLGNNTPQLFQNNPVAPGGSNQASNGFFSNAFDTQTTDANGVTTTQQGFLGPVVEGVGAVANIFLGLKGLDLAEDQFNFQKEAFRKNFEANRKAFNNAIRARARAVANATSASALGLGDNASIEERERAEQAYVENTTKDQLV